MHLTLSIAGHGHHPAAWRVSSPAAQAGGLPRYDAPALRAQAGLLDAVFFVPPARDEVPGDGASDTLNPDALPLIGSLVARTGHLGLGASVPVAYTEPFHTARAFSVLDNLSAGRAAWLVDLRGAGRADPRHAHVAQLDAQGHYERAREYIEVAMQLWDSWEDEAVVADKAAGVYADSDRIHPIHHAGKYFTVRGPLTAVRPRQGHPVIVMDDMSEQGRGLAAAFADVVLASCGAPGEAAALAADLRSRAAACGRTAGSPRVLATVSPILAGSDEAAAERARQLDALAGPDAPGLPGLRYVGTPAGLADLMAEWHAVGACDGFNVAPPVLAEDLDTLAGAVLPLLQQRGLFRTAYEGASLREHLGLARPLNRYSRKAA
ncbi:LLM class flavin-dependent oxidoreductase [Verticiella sediminum]|nr:LLM class flavin-dependent oxidoreductase [Verticiella sediminum]